MKIDDQRKYKRILEEQVIPTLTDPKITDNDMISMYGKTKLEVAIAYLDLFVKKLG